MTTPVLDDELRRFVDEQIASGRFAAESDVLTEALRRMRQEEGAGPLWGLFRDEPDLIDQMTEGALSDRRELPLRGRGDE
jgi:putative addiction module CopG family antidote